MGSERAVEGVAKAMAAVEVESTAVYLGAEGSKAATREAVA